MTIGTYLLVKKFISIFLIISIGVFCVHSIISLTSIYPPCLHKESLDGGGFPIHYWVPAMYSSFATCVNLKHLIYNLLIVSPMVFLIFWLVFKKLNILDYKVARIIVYVLGCLTLLANIVFIGIEIEYMNFTCYENWLC